MDDKGVIAPSLSSSLVNPFKAANKNQYEILNDHSSVRLKDFFINASIPVTLCSKMLLFRDTNKSFKLDGDVLKTITNYNLDVGPSNPQNQKVIYHFGKEKK